MDKSLLSRATDSTTAPTPGYLYNDIGKTLTSPQACIDTSNYLIARLSKNNVHIKKKCCKVLAKLIVHPVNRGMLKRTLAQNPNAIASIKECTAWRGTMDAVTGDQWNVEVREAAKECLDVVYSDSGEGESGGGGSNFGGIGMGGGGGMAGLQQQQQGGGYGGPVAAQGIGGGGYGAPMGGSSGSGYGNDSYGGAQGATGGGSRMEGIGNPMFSDPRLAQQQSSSSTVGKLSQMATDVGGAMLGMIKDPLAKQAAAIQQQPHPNMGTYGGPNMRPDPYSQPPGRNNLAMQTGGQWTMASNRGPNAIGGCGHGHNGGGMAPPVAEAPRHDDSEYYKARNATGTAFNWASAGGGAPAPPAAAAAPVAAAPTVGGVGGSWATAPVAPPPPPAVSTTPAASTPQLSVAAQSRMDANQSGPYSGGGGGGFVAPSATAAGDYEKNLIAELCPPGGMKAEPPQDKLQDFARSVPSLNPDLVCPALLDALEDGNPWIMRAKALCVIETVLKVMDQQQGESNAYADFFHACACEIEPLANHARQSVKAPAKRVLGLLGVAPGTATAASPMRSNGATAAAARPVVAAAEAPNLLDFGGPSDVPAAPVAPAPPAPPAPPVVQSVANVSSGGDSMFGGMTVKSTAPAASSPAAPALVSTESTESSGDLLGSFSVSAEPAPVVAAVAPSSGSSNLFGNMTVKSTPAAAEPVAAAPTAPTDASSVGPSSGGSAFGFLNATTTPSTPSRPAPKPMAPASPAASYDPLLTLGATTSTANNNGAMNGMNTANPMAQMNTAQMNPAQMQQMQMAYQQNMMMMQQQMQQMQMGAGGAGGQAYGRQGSNPNIMGANYMRQVPGVQGDNGSSFSFLGAPKKKDTHEFDFVKDAMKRG
eukprot:scaffold7003_cov106-Skeletonema_dohrnii-CCMP3373.AAC.1